jgi:hypothetical protein
VTGCTHWTDGPDVAVCGECGTPFAGMVCPTCRQLVEPHERRWIWADVAAGRCEVIAERTPDPVLDALLDDRGWRDVH